MFLSVCIPSYNRFDHLQQILCSLENAKSWEFDIIIVDNGSPSDIDQAVQGKDDRIKIIRRETVVPGPTNVALALDYADGEFVLLCLDKDFIIGERLDSFIEKLKKCPDVTCGYSSLNCKHVSGTFEISGNIVENIFRCRHPSGVFFRRACITGESDKMDLLNIESPYYNNPFLIDLLYAKCLCCGKQGRFTGELIKTEPAECAARQKSYSYSKAKGDIYFTSDNRIKQFMVFVLRMDELNISWTVHRQIINRLIDQTMRNITVGYKEIMSNEAICAHHGIEVESIGKKYQVQQIFEFLKVLRHSRFSSIRDFWGSVIIWTNVVKALIRVVLKG